MKKTYMERLERWARWMLAAAEAESVVSDYRDIVGTPPRPEEELLRDPEGFVRWIEGTALTNALLPAFWQAPSFCLRYGGTAAALTGVWALVKARLCDRRWAAVYVMALAAMMVSMESEAALTMLANPSGPYTVYVFPLMVYCGMLAVGAVGAGVLLC